MPGLLTIRADAGPVLGSGHVMRMLALGQAWQDAGGAVRLVGRVEPGLLRERVRAEGVEILELDKPHPDPAELETLLNLTQPGEWVALDGYHLDTPYMRALRTSGRKVLVLDDINDRGAYEADILLNQNLGAEGFAYALNPDALPLLGPRFALLRREFQGGGQGSAPVAERATRLLATFGGADPADLCSQLMDALEELACSDLEVTFVAGAANPRCEALRKRSQSLPGRISVLQSAENMAGLMRQTDLAVGAAGSTCWELCALGVPMLVTAVAENQQGILAGLVNAGAARKFVPGADPKQLAQALKSLLDDAEARQAMRSAGRALVDGRGAGRVVRAMLQHGHITLRKAMPEDSGFLLTLANDPAVRQSSFSPKPIPPSEHARWFEQKLATPDSRIWIAERAGQPIGAVRYDKDEENAAEIDIALAQGQRGLGLGPILLRQSERMAYAELAVDTLRGVVHSGNVASRKCFLHAGFAECGPRMVHHVECMVYEKHNRKP